MARKQRELQMQIDPGNPHWEFLSMIRDYQSQLVYRPLRITDPVLDNRICVCVRKRPLSKKELIGKEVEVVTIPSKDRVIVHQPQTKVDLTKFLVNQQFKFDYTFNENSSNELVYKFVFKFYFFHFCFYLDLVHSLLSGLFFNEVLLLVLHMVKQALERHIQWVV